MFIETSNNIYGQIVFVSFDRTDIIQISNNSFITMDSRIQLEILHEWIDFDFNYYNLKGSGF